jgi:hypothetical protein
MPKRRLGNNIKIEIKQIESEDVGRLHVAQARDNLKAIVYRVKKFG